MEGRKMKIMRILGSIHNGEKLHKLGAQWDQTLNKVQDNLPMFMFYGQ